MSPIEAGEPLARISDVQRLSLHDGPGIRTCVFFKGCPLRCLWCHNPESWSPEPRLRFNASLCRSCGDCVAVCPQGVHQIVEADGRRVHRVDHDRCTACGRCVDVCCSYALEVVGRDYSVEGLLNEIRADLPYYSLGAGGGLTLTGGEPLSQIGFLDALLDRTGDIDICIETSGYAPTESLQRIVDRTDLFLFDYKVSDPELHKRLCGVGNELILRNLDFLCKAGARVILRLPLIPGVNDDEGHFAGVAALLRKYPQILRAEIMPYHNLGVSKVADFGLDVPVHDAKNATDEQIRVWLDRFREAGAERVFVS